MVGIFLSTGSMAAEHCGRVSIAAFTWTSAEFIAQLDKIILRVGFGCDAVVVPGDTVPSTNSMMAIGQPDIAPEVWINSIRESLAQGVDDRLIRFAGRTFTRGGEEGFWVSTSVLAEHPELASIEGIKANAKLFYSEIHESPVVWGCPEGWACHISMNNLFRALNLAEAGFDMVVPASGDELAKSIVAAFDAGVPWLGYYWSPTALMGKVDLTLVDFGTGVDADHFRACIGKVNCQDPQVTMFPPSSVWTLVSEEFAVRSVDMMSYLGARSFENDLLSSVLAWIDANGTSAEAAAYHFLKSYPDVWQSWLPPDVAKSVSESL